MLKRGENLEFSENFKKTKKRVKLLQEEEHIDLVSSIRGRNQL